MKTVFVTFNDRLELIKLTTIRYSGFPVTLPKAPKSEDII